ncbi:universal stress protein [Salinigranum halophilum]|uniref:universal stress protein n=1 Tax=Salinigranum halophilum TaxID=2565931 RepID=UPI003743ECB9
MDDSAAETYERGIGVETVVALGTPGRPVLAVAEERAVDRSMMNHGQSGVEQVGFGSVAETVTRWSPPPVTSVR